MKTHETESERRARRASAPGLTIPLAGDLLVGNRPPEPPPRRDVDALERRVEQLERQVETLKGELEDERLRRGNAEEALRQSLLVDGDPC